MHQRTIKISWFLLSVASISWTIKNSWFKQESLARKSLSHWLLPFLWMGHIFDFFHISGNALWLTQFLKMIESGFKIAKSHSFNILMDISSCPWALRILSDLIILIMSLSSNWTEESCYLLTVNCYLLTEERIICYKSVNLRYLTVVV